MKILKSAKTYRRITLRRAAFIKMECYGIFTVVLLQFHTVIQNVNLPRVILLHVIMLSVEYNSKNVILMSVKMLNALLPSITMQSLMLLNAYRFVSLY